MTVKRSKVSDNTEDSRLEYLYEVSRRQLCDRIDRLDLRINKILEFLQADFVTIPQAHVVRKKGGPEQG